MIPTRAYLIVAGALVVAALGFWGGWTAHAPNKALIQQAQLLERQADALDAKADSLTPQIDHGKTTIAQLTRELDQLRKAAPMVSLVPGTRPAVPGETTPDNLAPIVEKQDELIHAESDQIGLLETKLEDREAAEKQLRAANVLLTPERPRPWALGVVRAFPFNGQPAEIGAVLHRDLGPVFLQVEGFKNRVSLAAGWRF